MPVGRSNNWIAIAALLISIPAVAQQGPLASPGFQHFYNLEYDLALADFTRDAASAPRDPGPQNHIAQTILFQAMYQHGALESDLIGSTNPFASRPKLPVNPEQQKSFEAAIGKAIDLSQARLSLNASDPYALYTMGVAIGLRANWNYVVHKAWVDPLKDATQARRLHMQATAVDPNFYDARLVQGAHDYLIGTLPFSMKMLGFLAGFHGDREGGIRTLRTVVEKGSTNRADASVLLAAILRREKKQAEAVPLLLELTNQFPRNYLFRFELALLYADLRDPVKALAQIETIEQFRAKGTPGFRLLTSERVSYMRGNIHFLLRDYDQALPHLWTAAKGAVAGELDANAVAQAWLRLGQTYDAKGRRNEALRAYRMALQVGPQTASAREAKDHLSSPFKHKQA